MRNGFFTDQCTKPCIFRSDPGADRPPCPTTGRSSVTAGSDRAPRVPPTIGRNLERSSGVKKRGHRLEHDDRFDGVAQKWILHGDPSRQDLQEPNGNAIEFTEDRIVERLSHCTRMCGISTMPDSARSDDCRTALTPLQSALWLQLIERKVAALAVAGTMEPTGSA